MPGRCNKIYQTSTNRKNFPKIKDNLVTNPSSFITENADDIHDILDELKTALKTKANVENTIDSVSPFVFTVKLVVEKIEDLVH